MDLKMEVDASDPRCTKDVFIPKGANPIPRWSDQPGYPLADLCPKAWWEKPSHLKPRTGFQSLKVDKTVHPWATQHGELADWKKTSAFVFVDHRRVSIIWTCAGFFPWDDLGWYSESVPGKESPMNERPRPLSPILFWGSSFWILAHEAASQFSLGYAFGTLQRGLLLRIELKSQLSQH